MLKKSKLAAAIMAGMVASAAHAANTDPDGTGEVLIYPYYNVNNGFQTQFTIVNTTSAYKAVKVRLRESNVSNDVLDFNLYMSPQDVWSATVRNVNGIANIITADNTCIYPSTAALQAGVDLRAVYTATSDADAREGYIEVIEMGEIPSTLYTNGNYSGAFPANVFTGGGAANQPTGTTIASQIKHDSNGMPADCSVINSAWGSGTFGNGGGRFDDDLAASNGVQVPGSAGSTQLQDPINLSSPTGGLVGELILLNVTTGSAYVADPTAIDNYSNGTAGVNVTGLNGAQHYRPDDPNYYLIPGLASGEALYATVVRGAGRTMEEVLWRQTTVDYGLLDTNVAPNVAVPSGSNPFPIATALAVRSFMNEYFVEAAFEGATDWVVTLPMKKHGIFSNNAPMLDNDTTTAGNQPALAALSVGQSGGREDVQIAFATWDREEQQTQSADFSPPVQQVTSLNKEVNILSLTTSAGLPTSPVLGSTQAQALATNFESGWGSITFDPRYALRDLTAGAAPETNERFVVDDTPAGKTGYLLDSDGAAGTIGAGGADGTFAIEGFAGAALTAVTTAASNIIDIIGVPATGFAATRGNTGTATMVVGETIPFKPLTRDTGAGNNDG